MTQTLDTQREDAEGRVSSFGEDAGLNRKSPWCERFLGELLRMTPQERIRASRYSFNLRERSVYAARFPEEVPLVNGELEWIALTLE